MTDRQDVLFEIDTDLMSITFIQSGVWPGFMHVNQSYDPDGFLREFADRYVDRDDVDIVLHTLSIDEIINASWEKRPFVSVEFRALTPESGLFEWYLASIITPRIGKSYGSIQNIQREKEKQLSTLYRADHDTLTGLYNRTAFEQRLVTYLAEPEKPGAFFILDMDDFKRINDTKGHVFGDRLLVETAAAIRDVLPENALFGRFGGDEFIVYCPYMADHERITEFAAKLTGAARSIADNVGPTISVGGALFPDHGTSMHLLLSSADLALYSVKAGGKDGFLLYDPSLPSIENIAKKKAEKALYKRRLIVKSPVKPKLLGLITAAILLASGMIIFSAIVYVLSLEQMIDSESADYLNEISGKIDNSIAQNLNSKYDSLSAMGIVFSNTTNRLTMANLKNLMDKQQQNMGFAELGCIADDKVWYTKDGQASYPELNQYILESLITGTPNMSDPITIDGKKCVAFLVPTKPFDADGITFSVIGAFISLDSLKDTFTHSLFYGQGLSYILDPSGNILTQSSDSGTVPGNNLIDSLKIAVFGNGGSLRQIERNFSYRTSDVTRYNLNGREYIACYSPLSAHDWVLFSVVPTDVLESNPRSFLNFTILVSALTAFVLLSLIVILFLLQTRNRKKLEQLAYVDEVTGGASRAKLVIDLRQRLDAKKRIPYSLVYANIDRFKLVNDRFGRDVGNSLLQYVYAVFTDDLRENELCGRLLVDRFCVLIATQDTFEIKERIRNWNKRIDGFRHAAENMYHIVLSYGIYQIDEPNLDVEHMIDRANIAHRIVDKSHGNSLRVAFYDEKLKEKMRFEQELEERMEKALISREFKMYLQPQYSAQTGMLAGFEALVRWEIAGRPVYYPGQFIPLFENNGFIVRLDLYMFEQACQFIRHLIDLKLPPVCVSVNVSRIHLISNDFMSDYLKIWQKYSVPTEYLEFEFTESVIYDNIHKLNQVVDQLRSYGFHSSIDDFGAGFSSLNMLHATCVDVLKLDRRFLGGKARLSPRSSIIVKNVVNLAKELGMQVVAEGVEYKEQVDFLRACGCDYFQGYFYAKPMPAANAIQLMEKNTLDGRFEKSKI